MADNFYVGLLIEDTRRTLYQSIESFSQNHCCLGRFAGLAIAPLNAVAMAANILAVVVDTILQIWHAFNTSCEQGFWIWALVTPIFVAIQIPLALIEGTIGLIYDIAAALISPIQWAHQRDYYHMFIQDRESPLGTWMGSVLEIDVLFKLC